MSTEIRPVSPSELRERVRKPHKTPQLFMADQHTEYEERIRSLRDEVHTVKESEARLVKAVEREQHKNAMLQRHNNELEEMIGHRETAYEELVNQHAVQTERLQKSEDETRSFKMKYDDIRDIQEEMDTMHFEHQKEKKNWMKTIDEQQDTIAYQQTLLDIAEAESADYDRGADLSAANMRLTAELEELKSASQTEEASVQDDPERTRLLAQMVSVTRSTERDATEWLKDAQRLFPAATNGEPDSPAGNRRHLLRLMFEGNQSTEGEYAEWLADVREVWQATHEPPSSDHSGPEPPPDSPQPEPLSEKAPAAQAMNVEYYNTLPSIPDDSASDDEAFFAEEAGEVEAGEVKASDVEVGDVAVGEVKASDVEASEAEASEVEAGEEVAQTSTAPNLEFESDSEFAAGSPILAQRRYRRSQGGPGRTRRPTGPRTAPLSTDESDQTARTPNDGPSGTIVEEIISADILETFRRASSTSSASSSEEETQDDRLLQFGTEWSTGSVKDAQQHEAVAEAAQRIISFSFGVLPPWQWNWWNLICGIFWFILFAHTMGFPGYELEGPWLWEIEKAKYRLIERIGGHNLVHKVYGV